MKKDTIIGSIGLIISAIAFIYTVTCIKRVPNLTEPGPLMMPILALTITSVCSLGILIQSFKQTEEDKPFFPKGGVKKVTIAYLELLAYGVALQVIGFVISTPFAICAFIYTLKGENKVRPAVVCCIGIVVTILLYTLFVKAFQIKLPQGMLF